VIKLKKANEASRFDLPYRPGVGMMIINKDNKVFIGQRIDAKNKFWQMPQGGIDLGETPRQAVMREMNEEIGTNKGKIIAESKYWYSYNLPKFLIPKLWEGKFCGQKQKWFLIRFTGEDQDINLNLNKPEFIAWKWVEIKELIQIIIPFKVKLYQTVINEFQNIINQHDVV
jgi:putative (di)nucleoside polyphosphate hydrolase